jgi:hypothetical protein
VRGRSPPLLYIIERNALGVGGERSAYTAHFAYTVLNFARVGTVRLSLVYEVI